MFVSGMKKGIIILPAIVLSFFSACAETGDSALAVIPFSVDRNKIIIETTVDNCSGQRIILDSGMPWDGLLLFQESFIHNTQLQPGGEAGVGGAGGGAPASSVFYDSVSFQQGNLKLDNQFLVVLTSEATQDFPTNGAIGWSLFGHYVMEIDYDSHEIRLFDPESYRIGHDWSEIDIELRRNIPYLHASVITDGNKRTEQFFYIDMGASDALELLICDSMDLEVPGNCHDTLIGVGLNGDIYGCVAFLEGLEIGGYVLPDIRTSFSEKEVRSRRYDADGVISNAALRRFNQVFDYSRNKLYIKPNSTFSEPFRL